MDSAEKGIREVMSLVPAHLKGLGAAEPSFLMEACSQRPWSVPYPSVRGSPGSTEAGVPYAYGCCIATSKAQRCQVA